MAGPASTVLSEARLTLGDPDPERPVVAQDKYRQALNRQATIVAKHIGIGPLWVTSAITTATNDWEYTLPSGSEYSAVLELVYASDKQPLRKVSREEILAARSGSATVSGRPLTFAMDLDPTGLVVVMFGMYPNRVEAIDAYVSVVPVEWGAGNATVPTIPFSKGGLQALALMTAHDVATKMGPDQMTALDLNAKAIEGMRETAMELIRLERLTVISLKRTRRSAWYSDWSQR